MRIELHTDRCVGHGRCYALAHHVFDADDDGHAKLLPQPKAPVDESRLDGVVVVVVPPEHERAARLAAANCPEQAITIDEFGTY